MENPFELLHQEIKQLRGLVSELLNRPAQNAPVAEKPIFIKDAAKLLNLSTSAVYKSIEQIPHTKRHGQYYFFESKLLQYLQSEKPAEEPKSMLIPRRPTRTKKSLESNP